MGKTKSLSEKLENLKNLYSTHGRRIHTVYDAGHGWKAYPCQTRVPPTTKLMNFDLVFGEVEHHKGLPPHTVDRRRTILCLDNYGNEIMCSKVHRNVMNGMDIFDYLLGIDRETGEIYCVSFLTEGKKLVVAFSQIISGVEKGIFLPKPWLKKTKLKELASQKRPFFLTLPDTALFPFVERFYGYKDLAEAILVDLHFYDVRLQVGIDMHRTISNWK